ncbi:hypothetical protein [Desulfosporosinus sp. SB140]|uniref:hypothetical protein n=1 Tax=Desulfosporosinus paludis TaxID=3115649 RepID=UPI00388F0FBD
MKTKVKVLILLLVSVLSMMALLVPRFSGSTEFTPANRPQIAFEDAKKSGKPIFLEFYAKW